MYCLSVSHKTSNVVVRKKLAFPDEQKKTFLDELYYFENISECLILCTCNRTEVYFCGDESSVKTVETVLSDFSGIDFDELKKYICLFYGDRALLHLFRVAGGIESMVIGEDEILGQLKRAYAFAKDNGTVAYELNMCVQAAVACAKKIKTETAISKTSVSVATLASNEAAKFKDGELNVLVIGATGKVGSTVVKNLLSHKGISVTVTSRKHKAETVFENTGANVIDYDERYKAFDFADCVISATSGPHYTVTYYDLKKNIVALSKFGIVLNKCNYDTMIALYLLNYNVKEDIAYIANTYNYNISFSETMYKKKEIDINEIAKEAVKKARV